MTARPKTGAEPMQLDEFISETISQIIKGVRDAQEREKTLRRPGLPQDLQAGINPRNIVIENSVTRPSGHQNIEFDVALTVESGAKTKGGISVLANVIKAGISKESDTSNSAVNRVKFVVPVVLPFDRT
jgi:preprotein translocase subunit SecB